MRKFKSLTIALMKNNLNFITDGKGGKGKTLALYLLLAVCMIPLIIGIYFIFAAYFEGYGAFSQTGTVLAIGFFISAFLVFFFSLFVIPGVFYFSKDNDTLLCLPLQPHTILAAKFTNCLLYDYAFSFMVTIPLGIAYMQYMPFGVWELFCFLLVAVTLPIIPLIYSSIITMIVMRFVPFVKNRDTFNMISGILIVGLSLGFSLYMNSMSPADETALLAMLMEGNNSMVQLFSTLFPFVPNAARMIFDADILQAVCYVLWNAGCIALFLIIGKYVYFKGAIGVNESSSRSQRIDIRKHTHRTPVLRSYARKEWKILLRTPAYFLNCILSVIIIPFMLLVMFFQPEIKEGLASLPIDEILAYPQLSYYIILAMLLFSCFAAPLNMIASTAISREGDHVSFMKFIPVSYEIQLYAKISFGILLGMISILPLWLLVIAYLGFPLMLTLVSLIGILLCNLAINMMGILIDLSRPKLIWEQEAAAVKQNLNSMLTLLTGILISILIGVGMFLLPSDLMMLFTMGVLLFFIIVIAVCYGMIRKYAGKLFEKIA